MKGKEEMVSKISQLCLGLQKEKLSQQQQLKKPSTLVLCGGSEFETVKVN